MADITDQRLSDHLDLEIINDSLERDLFTIHRKIAKLSEERRVEDKTMRLTRAHQNELIASTRRKEDSDAALKIGEDKDEDSYRLERRNTQLTRAREDAILASNRRKEAGGTALRRIDENKECDLIKLGIIQKQSVRLSRLIVVT